MTMTSLKGRHALVTGGGRGIGRAIAGCLVKAGATVTIVGRSPATLEQAIVQGDAHAAAVADITDRQAVQAAVQEAVDALRPRRPADCQCGSGRLGALHEDRRRKSSGRCWT